MQRLYFVPPPTVGSPKSIWLISGPLSILRISFSLPSPSFLISVPLAKPPVHAAGVAGQQLFVASVGHESQSSPTLSPSVSVCAGFDAAGQLSTSSQYPSRSPSVFDA